MHTTRQDLKIVHINLGDYLYTDQYNTRFHKYLLMVTPPTRMLSMQVSRRASSSVLLILCTVLTICLTTFSDQLEIYMLTISRFMGV